MHLNEINNIDAILAKKLKVKFREQRKKIGKKNLASNAQVQKYVCMYIYMYICMHVHVHAYIK